MIPTRFLSQWRQFGAALAFATTGLLGACGGGGGGDAPASGSSPPPAPAPAPAPAPGPAPAPSPAPPASSSNLDASTYVIVLKTNRGSFHAFGTGFAIDDRLIATNSHVTRGVLETARRFAASGTKITGVSAFQSETGREVVLLEALVHPSYTGSTRSPDVGLFVARESLLNRLSLASPEQASLVRKADGMQVNGFPGDVWDVIMNGFTPGQSVPQASLFSGSIQALRNFDERVLVNPPSVSTIDMFEHSADTSGGTSGSPILQGDKVIAVHNSGLQQVVLTPNPNGPPIPEQIAIGTASWGVHVKHLHNLIKEYHSGVLEADKRFRLPPSDELVGAGGGQSSGGGGAGSSFSGNVSNPNNVNVAHQLNFSVDQGQNITGTTAWPANPSLGFGARSFSLRGKSDANGRLEFADNTPEVVAGFRRGVYIGNLNPASGQITGQYYEVNESTNELFYFGDWTAGR